MRIRVTLVTFMIGFLLTGAIVWIVSALGLIPAGLLPVSAAGIGLSVAAAWVAGRLSAKNARKKEESPDGDKS